MSNPPDAGAGGRIVDTTDDTFERDVLQSEVPVLVDFWAPWCGPCKSVAPVLEEIVRENEDLRVAKVNVDGNPQAAQKYNVRAIPTLLLFKKGAVAGTRIGAVGKADLLALLDSADE